MSIEKDDELTIGSSMRNYITEKDRCGSFVTRSLGKVQNNSRIERRDNLKTNEKGKKKKQKRKRKQKLAARIGSKGTVDGPGL